MVEVAAASSILNVGFYNMSDAVMWKTDLSYTISYDSLGTPSCALVTITCAPISYTNLIGTFGDLTQCNKFFRGNLFIFFLIYKNVLKIIYQKVFN